MYHPISVQAIRQSLALAGMPTPTRIVQVAQQKMPDGRIISTYWTLMNEAELDNSLLREWEVTGNDKLTYRDMLNGCFSKDIYVVDTYPSQFRGAIRIVINTVLHKRVHRG